jgi:hypothetical protein
MATTTPFATLLYNTHTNAHDVAQNLNTVAAAVLHSMKNQTEDTYIYTYLWIPVDGQDNITFSNNILAEFFQWSSEPFVDMLH